MTFVSVYSACYVCGLPFYYNPNHVPSVVVAGVREPVCGTCIARANVERQRRGLDALEVHPSAYDGEPVELVDFGDREER
jgi:hypothetical protein